MCHPCASRLFTPPCVGSLPPGSHTSCMSACKHIHKVSITDTPAVDSQQAAAAEQPPLQASHGCSPHSPDDGPFVFPCEGLPLFPPPDVSEGLRLCPLLSFLRLQPRQEAAAAVVVVVAQEAALLLPLLLLLRQVYLPASTPTTGICCFPDHFVLAVQAALEVGTPVVQGTVAQPLLLPLLLLVRRLALELLFSVSISSTPKSLRQSLNVESTTQEPLTRRRLVWHLPC